MESIYQTVTGTYSVVQSWLAEKYQSWKLHRERSNSTSAVPQLSENITLPSTGLLFYSLSCVSVLTVWSGPSTSHVTHPSIFYIHSAVIRNNLVATRLTQYLPHATDWAGPLGAPLAGSWGRCHTKTSVLLDRPFKLTGVIYLDKALQWAIFEIMPAKEKHFTYSWPKYTIFNYLQVTDGVLVVNTAAGEQNDGCVCEVFACTVWYCLRWVHSRRAAIEGRLCIVNSSSWRRLINGNGTNVADGDLIDESV